MCGGECKDAGADIGVLSHFIQLSASIYQVAQRNY